MGLAGGLTHAMLSSASRLAPAITERGHLAAGSQLSTITRRRLLLCETRGGRADHGGGECSSEQKRFHDASKDQPDRDGSALRPVHADRVAPVPVERGLA